ncbi:MAG: hypothetical protein ACTHYN_06835 [Marinobacter sp.]|uniref:hypothetical protein n=1 Tax=Marinobacter sp. TaxID=50741 RepID=UPI003F9A3D46
MRLALFLSGLSDPTRRKSAYTKLYTRHEPNSPELTDTLRLDIFFLATCGDLRDMYFLVTKKLSFVTWKKGRYDILYAHRRFQRGVVMLKVVNKTQAGFLVVFSALALGACGGGGGSGGSSDGGSTVTKLKPGVYDIGRKFSNGKTKEGISLISPSGQFVSALGRAAFGPLEYSGSGKFSGPIVEYTLNNSSEPLRGTVSGVVKSSRKAELTASKSDLRVSGALGRKDKVSDLGLTLNELSGTYNGADDSDKTLWINIDPAGEVTGGDRGCVFNGNVTIPDKTVNVFEITYKAETCDEVSSMDTSAKERNGDYSGLGAYIPTEDGKKMLFYSQNGTVAWRFESKKS